MGNFSYDVLNRNSFVTEAQQNSAGTWTFNLFTQNLGYDRWGNRTVSCSPCQTGVTGDNFTVDTATNRLTAKNGVGMTYDSAGNQTYDATGNRWFDGENRMYKAVQSGTTSYYVYDSDGKRVRRIVGSTETWMVYGIDGELVAEYAVNGAVGSPQEEYGYRSGQMLIVAQTSPLEIRWMVPDHLGTPRMNIMGNGASGGLLSSVKRHDYLPFGEELFAGVGLRSSSSHGYEPPSDGVRQKFTGYEHDTETNLEYAQARYYANVQGRFIGVDQLLASGRISNPQSWNRFSYVLNRPLSIVDPTGFEGEDVDETPDQNKPKPKPVVVFIGGGLSQGGPNDIGNAGPVSGSRLPDPNKESENGTAALINVVATDWDVNVRAIAAEAVPNMAQQIVDAGADQVIIYGYSAGGVAAVDLSNRLTKAGVSVSDLILVDPPVALTYRVTSVEAGTGEHLSLNNTGQVCRSVCWTGSTPATGQGTVVGVQETQHFNVPHMRMDEFTAQRAYNRISTDLQSLGAKRRSNN